MNGSLNPWTCYGAKNSWTDAYTPKKVADTRRRSAAETARKCVPISPTGSLAPGRLRHSTVRPKVDGSSSEWAIVQKCPRVFGMEHSIRPRCATARRRRLHRWSPIAIHPIAPQSGCRDPGSYSVTDPSPIVGVPGHLLWGTPGGCPCHCTRRRIYWQFTGNLGAICDELRAIYGQFTGNLRRITGELRAIYDELRGICDQRLLICGQFATIYGRFTGD